MDLKSVHYKASQQITAIEDLIAIERTEEAGWFAYWAVMTDERRVLLAPKQYEALRQLKQEFPQLHYEVKDLIKPSESTKSH